VILEKNESDVLGIDMMDKDGDILILSIWVEGLFRQWNISHPRQCVQIGDRIRKVNDVAHGFVEKVAQLRVTGTIRLTILSCRHRLTLPRVAPIVLPRDDVDTETTIAWTEGKKTVSKAFLEELPHILAEQSGAMECSICLEDFDKSTVVVCLPCCHCFHDACVAKWLTEKSNVCPLCNIPVDGDDLKKQGQTQNLRSLLAVVP